MFKNNFKCFKVSSLMSRKEIKLLYKKLKTLEMVSISSHLKSCKLTKKSDKPNKGFSSST